MNIYDCEMEVMGVMILGQKYLLYLVWGFVEHVHDDMLSENIVSSFSTHVKNCESM